MVSWLVQHFLLVLTYQALLFNGSYIVATNCFHFHSTELSRSSKTFPSSLTEDKKLNLFDKGRWNIALVLGLLKPVTSILGDIRLGRQPTPNSSNYQFAIRIGLGVSVSTKMWVGIQYRISESRFDTHIVYLGFGNSVMWGPRDQMNNFILICLEPWVKSVKEIQHWDSLKIW